MASLPVKALRVLADFKVGLEEQIAKAPTPIVAAPQPPRGDRPRAKAKKEKKAERGPVARHARTPGGAFQRMCQRRDWASPIY